MSTQNDTVKVVILVGGPSKGTRFRPLSLDVAKPLFPVAGQPMIHHHLDACMTLKGLSEVILLGFYNDQAKEWQDFMKKTKDQYGINIRYLKENSRLGTAGGLRYFRNEILSGNPSSIILIHCDIVCSFPLNELLSFHRTHGKECTILGKQVPKEEAHKYGCLAIEPGTMEVLHYAEKPETFVGDVINAGIYVFSPQMFDLMDQLAQEHKPEIGEEVGFMRLEQDVFQKLCGDKHVYVYMTADFWLQVKSAGTVVQCAEYLLKHLRKIHPEKLAQSKPGGPAIVGDVLINPTAQVDPTAKLGPNVSIGSNVKIGPGVRIINSVVLSDSEIRGRCCIMHSVIGWNCVVGPWSRLEGIPNFNGDNDDPLTCGVTILGSGVSVGAESIVRACIALPHKDLSGSYSKQILL